MPCNRIVNAASNFHAGRRSRKTSELRDFERKATRSAVNNRLFQYLLKVRLRGSSRESFATGPSHQTGNTLSLSPAGWGFAPHTGLTDLLPPGMLCTGHPAA